MDELINQAITYLQAHGLGYVVVLIIGVFSPRFIPQLRRFAAATPTKVDDFAVAAMDACLNSNKDKIDSMTVAELDKFVTNEQLVKLVRIRKERLAAAKANA